MVKKQIKNQGITLIELIVVLGIFSVISAILVFNYSSFRSNISIRNLAQEVGLAIRKAQAYATSVRGIDIPGASARDYPAFGISFEVGNAVAIDNRSDEKEFVLFSDIAESEGSNSNYRYDFPPGGTTCGTIETGQECLEKFRITSPDRINRICISDSGGETCLPPSARVDIVFKRPNPDAIICVVENGVCDTTPSGVRIELESEKGIRRNVTVWNTGQISIE